MSDSMTDTCFHARNPLNVVIIGNIGSGKSTLCKKIANKLKGDSDGFKVGVVNEPVELWQRDHMLEELYKNPKKTAAIFQMVAFSDRLVEYKKVDSIGMDVIISDGHVLLDRYAFFENLVNIGSINEYEALWYKRRFDQWRILVPIASPDITIFINAAPETCKTRKDERKREEESGIPIDYLVSLQDTINRNKEFIACDSITVDLTVNTVTGEYDDDSFLSIYKAIRAATKQRMQLNNKFTKRV